MDALVLVVGIFTGVAANILTHLFVTVWLPTYRNYTYQGVRIDGTWKLSESKETADGGTLATDWVLSATLDQKAYVIRGTANATQIRDSQPVDVINYDVVGTINDGFVSLTFCNRDRTRIAHSTYLLQVSGGGGMMKGYRAFYGFRKETIRSIASIWSRENHHDTKDSKGCNST